MTKDEALKLALEALEEPHPGIRTSFTDAITYREKAKQAIAAIKESLAQPEQETPKGWKSEIWKSVKQQEPVTWGVDWGKAGDIPCVSIIKRVPNGSIDVMAVEYAPYSYTTPPQRTWVGLTDEEIALIDWESLITKKDCVQAIETKIKEKNNG